MLLRDGEESRKEEEEEGVGEGKGASSHQSRAQSSRSIRRPRGDRSLREACRGAVLSRALGQCLRQQDKVLVCRSSELQGGRGNIRLPIVPPKRLNCTVIFVAIEGSMSVAISCAAKILRWITYVNSGGMSIRCVRFPFSWRPGAATLKAAAVSSSPERIVPEVQDGEEARVAEELEAGQSQLPLLVKAHVVLRNAYLQRRGVFG